MSALAGLVVLVTVSSASPDSAAPPATSPLWTPGPYLLLDETLIAEQSNLSRRLSHPSRLSDPIVTGYEDGCFQPWLTVVRDPQTRRFRLWYNVPASPGNTGESRLAYLESEDGIHWLRPHRLLQTPRITFGASVIDTGPTCADPSQRFKLGWWRDGGLRIATSPDGLTWTPLAEGVILPMNHDITAIDWDPLRGRYLALLSANVAVGSLKGLRIPHESTSPDLLQWRRPPWMIVRPDSQATIEQGETQFYGMSAVLARGRLLVSMVKVLRDDLNAEPGRTAADLHDPDRPFAGLGYTVLAWSHDGEHWQRETEPFLDRNPQPGTWDRAMTWIDDQLVVGDCTYFYYGGYRWGHKAERFTERQIGFAQLPRDRYVGFVADATPGRLRTPTATMRSADMTVNARIDPSAGELRVRVLDAQGRPRPGFDWEDCRPVHGDRVDHPIAWKGANRTLNNEPVQFEFELKHATLYSFDLR